MQITKPSKSTPSRNAEARVVTNLSGSARQQLEFLIDSGVLMPGDPIDERALASRLGMSRTPVREALQQLRLQGLVQVVPRQGIHVARASIKSLLAMFELLAELEGVAAKLAARRIDDVGRKLLAQSLEGCREAQALDDRDAYSAANLTFHRALYNASSNSFLIDQLMHLRRRTQMYRRDAFQQRGRMQVSLADHERIAAAVLNGDEALASLEATAHVTIGGRGFADFISTLPEQLLES